MVIPPRLHYVMIGDDGSSGSCEKTSTEAVNEDRRPVSTHVELCHPVRINLRLTCCVDHHSERLSRLLVQKFHHDVQQANARPILVNNGLCKHALLLQQGEAILCVQKLLPQGISIRAIREGQFLAKVLGSCP